MPEHIPGSVYGMSAVQIAAGLAIPAAMMLWLRKNCPQGKRKAFWFGCLTFLLLAMVLESLLHLLVLRLSPAGPVILNNIWLYALYGAAAAAVFEEFGRYLAFRTVLRRDLGEDANALYYGAGHGGFEAFYILVLSAASNIVYTVLVNTGHAELLLGNLSGEALEQGQQTLAALAETPPATYLLAIAERLIAVTFHLSASVLVWFAAKDGVRVKGLLLLALALHFLFDFAVVLLAKTLPLAAVEAILAALVVGSALLTRTVWKRFAKAPEAQSE